MQNLLPIFTASGRRVLDADGKPSFLTNEEAVPLIKKAQVKLHRAGRSKNAARFLVIVAPKQDGKDGKDEKREKREDRIPMPEPYIVREHVGNAYVYRHVAHRCSAAQPFMEPVRQRYL